MGTTFVVPSFLRTVNRTSVPFLPRTKRTTLLMPMPTTSTGSSEPWATLSNLSPSSSSPWRHEALPVTMLATVMYSPFNCSCAPIPSNWPVISISKFSLARGAKYSVCGSKAKAKEFTYKPNHSPRSMSLRLLNHSSCISNSFLRALASASTKEDVPGVSTAPESASLARSTMRAVTRKAKYRRQWSSSASWLAG